MGCMLLWVMLAQVVPAATPAREVLVDVRVHGNHTTPDAEVIALAGLRLGERLEPAVFEAVEARLRKSGRFDGVEVRKRYRSLADAESVVIVLVIDEKPAPMAVPGAPPLRPLRALRNNGMFLPILTHADGYGFSYGVRVSFIRPFGARSRVTLPLTWGASKRAAVEADKRFTGGLLSRVAGGVAIGRREHPRYDVTDRRGEVWLRAERALPAALRIGAGVGWNDISFGGPAEGAGVGPLFDLDERMTTAGLDLTLDTRTDPAFPRDAVFARASRERLSFDARPGLNRYMADARGFLGLRGSAVLALRAFHGRSDAPLPPYERWLLGGAASLRGFRAGTFAGDRIVSTSAELRIPFSSPLRVGKTGVSVFVDAGKAWAFDEELRDQRWERGGGAGLFVVATVFQLKLDVARGSGGNTRVHFTTGLTF